MTANGADTDRVGVLLSKSTTTGWLDWMHGELWLFPDGILRLPVGWGKTLLSSLAYTFNPNRTVSRTFLASDFTRLIRDRRTRWIPRDKLITATLRRSLGADELRAELAGGRMIQLLWLPRDRAYGALQQPLHEWLGDRLIIQEAGFFTRLLQSRP